MIKKYIGAIIMIVVMVSTLDALSTTNEYNKSMLKTSMDLLGFCKIINRNKVNDSAGPNSIKSALKRKGYTLKILLTGKKMERVFVAVDNQNKNAIVIFSFGDESFTITQIKKALIMDQSPLTKMRWLKKDEKWKNIKVNNHIRAGYSRIRRQNLIDTIKNLRVKNIFVAGYGMGAGIATLAAVDIQVYMKRSVTLYTFGSPRIGHADFLEAFYTTVDRQFRIAVDRDPLPMIPTRNSGYKHVGKLLQLDANGDRIIAKKIKPQWRKMKKGLHKISVYQSALTKHFQKCKKSGASCYKKGVLAYSADLERGKR